MPHSEKTCRRGMGLLYIQNIWRRFLFARNFANARMRSYAIVNLSQNGGITLPFTDDEKSCFSPEFSTSQICILTLFKKQLSLKYLDLQYVSPKVAC